MENLSKREFFAVQILSAIINLNNDLYLTDERKSIRAAVKMADALIEELNTSQEKNDA